MTGFVAQAWLQYSEAVKSQVRETQAALHGNAQVVNMLQRLVAGSGFPALPGQVVPVHDFPAVRQLVEAGLSELAASHLHDRLQESFKGIHLPSFWQAFQEVLVSKQNIHRATQQQLAPLVRSLQALVLHASLARAMLQRLQEQLLQATMQARPGEPVSEGVALLVRRFEQGLGPLLLASCPWPGCLQELVVAFYASMQQQLAEAQKGREEREKDMQDAHMAASPEESWGTPPSSTPSPSRGTLLPLQNPRARVTELGVMDRRFYLAAWASQESAALASSNLQPRKQSALKASAWQGQTMSDGLRVFPAPTGADGSPEPYPPTGLDDSWSSQLATCSQCLHTLHLSDLDKEAYARVVFKAVGASIEASLADRASLMRAYLPLELAALRAVPLPFLQALLSPQADAQQQMGQWEDRLAMYVYELVGRRRIEQFFDIVVDHPESVPAVEDLAACLQHTRLTAHFSHHFTAAMQDRLLHAGAATVDILQQYVSAIRALRAVDPSRGLVKAVGAPIQGYLRGRTDAIRCIVAALTNTSEPGEGGEDAGGLTLADELARQPDEQGEEEDAGEGDDAAVKAYETWEPTRGPSQPSREEDGDPKPANDIIATLISIYGSKELFINEYRRMLGDKLLTKRGYECDSEIRTLELLKLRFGDANLHPCEVMLKDMADSKRLNASIQVLPPAAGTPGRARKRLPDISNMSASVLSGLFWPGIGAHGEEAALKLHPKMQEKFDAYANRYYILKAPRKLQWQPHLGTVEFTLTIGDAQREFCVSPLLATIILQFQDKSEWKASKLAAKLAVSPECLRRHIYYWLARGVVTEGKLSRGDVMYKAAESLSAEGDVAGGPASHMDAGSIGPDTSAESQFKQEMAVYEQYILGMLTNHTAGLELERIHNMLKMYVAEPRYDKTAAQLEAFLSQLVADDKLSVNNGLYTKRAQW